MIIFFMSIVLLCSLLIPTYNRLNATKSSVIYFLGLSAFSLIADTPVFIDFILWVISLPILFIVNHDGFRKKYLTEKILSLYKKLSPKISQTEQEALNAGDVTFEAELLQGKPNWENLRDIKPAKLTQEEQAFLDGQVEKLIAMIDDWEVTHELQDLPAKAWNYMKDEGFFGLIIPKEYGGLGFSAYLHSEVIAKLVSCGITIATTVSVPNSLGPAELLLHYGTEKQKKYYLPRLAKGLEIPCFALTSLEAGSDAGAIPDTGIIGYGEINGEPVLGIRLNWNKRYITLAPIATVLGLAFKLYDPNKLLSEKTEYGITCALIPTNLPGITIGRRHLPLNNPFQNGPTQGVDVFIPFDYVIGGKEKFGAGWQMLVECLSVGRAITLPGCACGGMKAVTATSGAYARIRKQFGMPIGYFEGIEESLAKIGGNTYISEAARQMTCDFISNGYQPSVASAILKYHTTERGQLCAKEAMDIHGGKGICLGPKNYLARGYQAAPIAITVEGANILTRNMIIFGQGIIRCHPYIIKEMLAANQNDCNEFDKAFFGHVAFFLSNFVRTVILSITSGKISQVNANENIKSYYQQLNRYSAALSFLSDLSLIIFGANLKRKESISARLGDILSLLYLGSSVLRRFEYEGENTEDLPLVNWAMQDLLKKIEDAFTGIIANFPNKYLALLLKAIIFPFGKKQNGPKDRITHLVAQIMLIPCAARKRLISQVGALKNPNHPAFRLEKALHTFIKAEPIYKKLEKIKDQFQPISTIKEQVEAVLKDKLISDTEAALIMEAEKLRLEVIAVDDFSKKELLKMQAKKNNASELS